MAKIGTAHVEIKPVLDEAALDRICERLEEAISRAIAKAVEAAANPVYNVTISGADATAYNGLCTCPAKFGPHPFHRGSPPLSSTR